MQKLHLVGFTTDHEGLILSTRRGARSGSYRVVVDEELAAAVEEARARQLEEAEAEAEVEEIVRPPRVESLLGVKEIQTRLRQGRSITDVARAAGVDPSWVERFAAPVFAEQAQVIATVLGARLQRPRLGASTMTIGDAVLARMADRGVNLTAEEVRDAWSTRQLADGRWVVRASFRARGKEVKLRYDLVDDTGEIRPHDRTSAMLGYVAPPTKPAAPKPAVAAARPAAKRATVTSGFRPDGPVRATSPAAKERERAAQAMSKAAAKRAVEAEKAKERRAREKRLEAERRVREEKAAAVAAAREAAAAARAKAAAERARAAEKAAADKAKATAKKAKEVAKAKAAAERVKAREKAAAERAKAKAAKLAAAQKQRAEAALAAAERARASATKSTRKPTKAGATKGSATKSSATKAPSTTSAPTRPSATKASATKAASSKATRATAAPAKAVPKAAAKPPAKAAPAVVAPARRPVPDVAPPRPRPAVHEAPPNATEAAADVPEVEGQLELLPAAGLAADVYGERSSRAVFRAGLVEPTERPAWSSAPADDAVAPDPTPANGVLRRPTSNRPRRTEPLRAT